MPIGNCRLAPVLSRMKPDDLKRRTKEFALRVLKLVAALPKTLAGKSIGGQLARAGTSVGANYRAACRARSKLEFIAKIGIVEEEADESAFWLELIIEGELLKAQLVESLQLEANELAKIMASSRKSASESLKTKPNNKLAIGNRKSAMTYG
ncbi:MAG: four helix bundle protein [Pyrinomonadaceae bacterium]